MNPITKAINESDEDFIERRSELRRLDAEPGNDSETVDFGYKRCIDIGDGWRELISVVDFGNIKRFNHASYRKILEAVKEIAESVIQSERYSGTPFSMNVLLKQIDEAIKDIK